MSVSFYDYVSIYSNMRPHLYPPLEQKEYYLKVMQMHEVNQEVSAYAITHWEYGWLSARRPYYRVYPKTVGMLSRLNIDRVQCHSLERPAGLDYLIIDMPKGNKLMDDGRDVQHFCMDFGAFRNEKGDMIVFGVNYGERITSEGAPCDLPMWDTWYFTKTEECPVAEQIDMIAKVDVRAQSPSLPASCHVLTSSELRRFTQLLCTLCLLEDDPDVIQPDVLAVDRSRLTPENRMQLSEKAHRRGRIGWTVGEALEKREVSPHYRASHPCLFHVGPGRRQQKVQLRSGGLVNREVISKIPTGYKDDQAQVEGR